MLPSRRVCLTDLNPHLLCVLCGGYFIDATTIIECLHSFCRTCIVRYLETSKYCPICDVQVHKTRPLQNIRSDQTLQDIVYKLVPGLFQNEMRLRREFYSLHSEGVPAGKEDAGEVTDACYIYSGDEPVSLSLQYAPSETGLDTKIEEAGRRYLRCPAAVTVAHLQKLLRAKHGLSVEHRVDICHEAAGQPLSNNFSLMDVAYIHQWKRKGPMHFYYQIFERPCKRRKVDEDVHSVSEVSAMEVTDVEEKEQETIKPVTTVVTDESGDEWKEVQLQISEAGIMKVTNLAAPTVVASETVISSGRVDNPAPPKEEDITKTQPSTENSQDIFHQKSDINGNKKEIERVPTSKLMQVPTSSSNATSSSSNNPVIPVIAKKQVESKPENIKKKSPQVIPTTPVVPIKPKERPVQQLPSVDQVHKKDLLPKRHVKTADVASCVKKPTYHCIGYKTLKAPPKSWNPSVSRGSYIGSHSTLSKSSTLTHKSDGEGGETSRAQSVPIQNKPPRFFKDRDRDRPRFLGNPVSGVKPMYQIQSDNRANPTAAAASQGASSSMIKIDPKTLSPMSSKVSVPSSNNNNHLSCNSITTGTGTITTTVASHRSTQSVRSPVNTVSSLPSVLHPPPNPLLYNYQSLMNSPLIRPPIMNSNSPQPYPPYPLPQSMFYGSQQPRFQHSLPAVQRIPSNVHANAQKSPSVPVSVTSSPLNNHPTTLSATSTSSSHAPKVEVPKVNGEVGEKPMKRESLDALEKATKPPMDIIPTSLNNGVTDAKKLGNGPIITSDTSTANKMVMPKVKPVDNGRITPQPETSKHVPPIAPAQASK